MSSTGSLLDARGGLLTAAASEEASVTIAMRLRPCTSSYGLTRWVTAAARRATGRRADRVMPILEDGSGLSAASPLPSAPGVTEFRTRCGLRPQGLECRFNLNNSGPQCSIKEKPDATV